MEMNFLLSRLIAIALALLIDLTIGEWNNKFHPVVLMGSCIRTFTERWNKGSSQQRLINGFLLILSGGILFALPFILLNRFLSMLPFWANGLLTGLLLKPSFAFTALIKAGREVGAALRKGDLPEARRLLGWHLVSRPTEHLSEGQLASGVIESLAENLTDSFFAPLFFFTLGGLPFAWFYRFVNTSDAMVAYRTAELEYFGKATAHLDDLLNWIPARLSGFALVLSAAIVKLNFRNAFAVMLKQNRRTSSPNAGWTMAAAAGALEVVLEKTDAYRLEGGVHLPTAGEIKTSISLLQSASVVILLLIGGTLVFVSFIL
jgi:adenosylcobinamide-phosphate synthase